MREHPFQFEDLIPAHEKVDMIVQGQGKLAAAGGHVDVSGGGNGGKGIIVKLDRQGPGKSRDHGMHELAQNLVVPNLHLLRTSFQKLC